MLHLKIAELLLKFGNRSFLRGQLAFQLAASIRRLLNFCPQLIEGATLESRKVLVVVN